MGNVEITLPRDKGFPPSDEFVSVIQHVDADHPDPEAVKRLGEWFAKFPTLCDCLGGDLLAITQDKLITRLHQGETGRMALKRKLALFRAGLGYDDSTQLERVLIDHVVMCWLRLQEIEWRYQSVIGTDDPTRPLYQCEWWERRLGMVQRRFLRSCESLARVRKLARKTPALQVNIATQGGQQVNVAGTINTPRGAAV